MNNSFFAILFRQRYIRRWGLMRNTREETLEEHAAETAMLAHALASIGNELFGRHYNADRAVTLALFHDATEVYTGDMPTPVKYYTPEIRESYKRIEAEAARRLCTTLPTELQPIYEPIICGHAAGENSNDRMNSPERAADEELGCIVKAADSLSAYIKCLGELGAGNAEFEDAAASTRKKLEQMHMPELDWFIDKMLEAFTVPIDRVGF